MAPITDSDREDMEDEYYAYDDSDTDSEEGDSYEVESTDEWVAEVCKLDDEGQKEAHALRLVNVIVMVGSKNKHEWMGIAMMELQLLQQATRSWREQQQVGEGEQGEEDWVQTVSCEELVAFMKVLVNLQVVKDAETVGWKPQGRQGREEQGAEAAE